MIGKNTLYLLTIIIVIIIMTDPSHALAVPMKRGESESESIPPFESLENITLDANTVSPRNFPVGKLTMKNPTNGDISACTGSVVNTPNGNIVVTAAHCLINTEGKVFRNIMFSPGFNNGKDGPLGQIGPAKVVKVPDTFLANKAVDDYGLIRFDFKTRDGRNLQQVTGALGLKAFNVGNNIQTTAFGYPSNGNLDNCPNDGGTLCSWSGRSQLVNNLYRAPGKLFGSGSSGGPWIMDYDPSTNLGHLYGSSDAELGQDTSSPVYNENTFKSLLDFVSK